MSAPAAAAQTGGAQNGGAQTGGAQTGGAQAGGAPTVGVQAAGAPTRFRPNIGRSVPAGVIRLVGALVMVGLNFSMIGWQPLLAVAMFLALATLVFPKTPAAWALAALLSVFSLGAFGAAPDWKFFVMLAGAHALHLFGMTLGWLPVGGPVQLRVLGRMLRTFVIIQVPAQLVSFVVLTLLAGRTVVSTLTSPAFGLIAGVGFVLLVIYVIVPAIRTDANDSQ